MSLTVRPTGVNQSASASKIIIYTCTAPITFYTAEFKV